MSEQVAPRISHGQFFWSVAAGIVAGGIFLWPTPLLVSAGADWAWALAADGVTIALTLCAQMAWGRRVPGMAMFGRLRSLWGPLAWPWLLGTTTLSLTVEAVFLALFVQMLRAFFFPATPAWPLLLILTGIAWVVASQSVDTLARNICIWFALGLMGFAIMVLMTAVNTPSPAALHVAFPPAASGVFSGVAGTWLFWNDDGAVALTLAPYTRRMTWASVRVWALGAAGLQLAMLAIVTAQALVAFGPWATRGHMWPMLEIMVGSGPTSLSFVRPSLIILPVWTGAFVSYLGVHTYCTSLNTCAAIGGPLNARRWHALAIVAVVLIIAWQLPAPPILARVVTADLGPLALAWTVTLHGASLARTAARSLRPARALPQQ